MYFLHTRVIEIATKHLAFRKIKPFDNEDDVRFWTDSEKNASWRPFLLAYYTAAGGVLPPSCRDQRVWSSCELLRQRRSTAVI